jgi:NADPH:quinone reductase-like Zn-dependent oxidoreductase
MHSAVVSVSKRGKLEILQVPTIDPSQGEVQVRVEWTASTPLDLHQNDGGLLVAHPQVLGDGVAGTVVKTGPGVEKLQVGDKVTISNPFKTDQYLTSKVFGFTWREQKEKAHQEFCTAPEYLLGKVPTIPSSSPRCEVVSLTPIYRSPLDLPPSKQSFSETTLSLSSTP